MKKQWFSILASLALVTVSLPLAACGEKNVSSTPISSADTSASVAESVESGDTLITLSAPDRGVAVGESITLTSQVYGPNRKIHYVSGDTSIASVDDNGVVTGLKPGFVNIRAVSVLSTEAKPLFASYTLFVEPTYIATMVKDFRGYDYGNGLNFTGKLRIMTSPASGSDSEEDVSLIAPFTFALKNNAYVAENKANYSLPSFDFRLSTDGDLGSLVGIATGKAGYTAKNIGLSSLDLSSPVFYSEEKSDAGLFGIYQPFSFYEKLASFIPQMSTIAPYFSSGKAIAEDIPTFLATAAVGLNSMLEFNNDGAQGIALKESAISSLNAKWPDVISAIKNSTSLDSTLKVLLPGILPDAFQDIRFRVTSDGAAFSALQLQIAGTKNNASGEGVSYHPLTIDFAAPKALESDYFTALATRFTTADKDVDLIAKVTESESPLYAILNAYKSDLYNTIHGSTRFGRLLKSYNADVYPFLAQVVNTPLIPTDHALVYGPYESFDITRQADAQKNILPDNYMASAGESFLLSAISPLGNTDATFDSFSDYTLTLSSASATLADYVTLEGNVLTVKQLPSTSKLTLSITPASVAGFTPIVYKLVLNKASA